MYFIPPTILSSRDHTQGPFLVVIFWLDLTYKMSTIIIPTLKWKKSETLKWDPETLSKLSKIIPLLSSRTMEWTQEGWL